jgi:hypothetical protein
MSRSFAVTFDYRCPFARNVHEHLVAGLRAGADWDVRFSPLSLSQLKVEPGGTDMWDEPELDSGLLALLVGVAVRDGQPEHFLAVHQALFALRHDEARDLRDEAELRRVVTAAGADADAAFAAVASGAPLEAVRKEHEAAVTGHDVWGVPTFVVGDHAVFVRLMNRPTDGETARRSIDRVVEMAGDWPELNEFKHTSLSQ